VAAELFLLLLSDPLQKLVVPEALRLFWICASGAGNGESTGAGRETLNQPLGILFRASGDCGLWHRDCDRAAGRAIIEDSDRVRHWQCQREGVSSERVQVVHNPLESRWPSIYTRHSGQTSAVPSHESDSESCLLRAAA
jgi:hypothetical protein